MFILILFFPLFRFSNFQYLLIILPFQPTIIIIYQQYNYQSIIISLIRWIEYYLYNFLCDSLFPIYCLNPIVSYLKFSILPLLFIVIFYDLKYHFQEYFSIRLVNSILRFSIKYHHLLSKPPVWSFLHNIVFNFI